MAKPRIWDLYCGGGGSAEGYHRAGFDVVGVDIKPQPNYPFEFRQADVMDLTPGDFAGFDAIHASPPCQESSVMSACRPGLAKSYDQLIPATRDLLVATGLPYVIENVRRAPLRHPTLLCGQMFGLDLYRHRLFEASLPLPLIMHPPHAIPGNRAGRWKPGTIISVAGHNTNLAECKRAMGIDWMIGDELSQAIPPAYTEWIGRYLLAHLALAEVAG